MQSKFTIAQSKRKKKYFFYVFKNRSKVQVFYLRLQIFQSFFGNKRPLRTNEVDRLIFSQHLNLNLWRVSIVSKLSTAFLMINTLTGSFIHFTNRSTFRSCRKYDYKTKKQKKKQNKTFFLSTCEGSFICEVYLVTNELFFVDQNVSSFFPDHHLIHRYSIDVISY